MIPYPKDRIIRYLPILFLFLAMTVTPIAAQAQEEGKYHNYAEMTARLQSLAQSYPQLIRLRSIGQTLEKRELWLLEIAQSTGTPVAQRPALLVAANLEGDQLIGSELALFLAESLAKNYPTDETVKQRLDNFTLYVAPRLNPDGAERMWATAQSVFRTNSRPQDADNDGRTEEDGPLDLNGDGVITVMRVKDPFGIYRIDPEEPRLMKKADPKKGERGEYALYREGRDQDQDGFLAEDGPGGVNINRNFMHEYPYYRPEAGHHMVSEIETRSILDFLLAHRNIAAMLAFGESDNLITPPNSAGRLGTWRQIELWAFADAGLVEADQVGRFSFESARFFGRRGMGGSPMGGGGQAPSGSGSPVAQMPARTAAVVVNSADLDYFKTISTKYVDLTGLRQTLVAVKPEGALFQYGYFQYGIPSFSTPGWGLSEIARGPGGAGGTPPAGGAAPTADSTGSTGSQRPVSPGSFSGRRSGGGASTPGGSGSESQAAGENAPQGIDCQLLQWMDREKVDGFVPWTPFRHPDLGEVEIGGFKPYAAMNPPPARIPELGKKHMDFVLYLASLFPRTRIAKLEAEALGGGLYRIKAEVENAGLLPTALAHAVTARAVKPVMVQLQVEPETILSGSPKTNSIPTLHGSGGRAKFEWLLTAKKGEPVQLKVLSEKGGNDQRTVALP